MINLFNNGSHDSFYVKGLVHSDNPTDILSPDSLILSSPQLFPIISLLFCFSLTALISVVFRRGSLYITVSTNQQTDKVNK